MNSPNSVSTRVKTYVYRVNRIKGVNRKAQEYSRRGTKRRVNSCALRSNDRLTASGLKIFLDTTWAECDKRLFRFQQYFIHVLIDIYEDRILSTWSDKNNIRSYITNLSERILPSWPTEIRLNFFNDRVTGRLTHQCLESKKESISDKQVCEEAMADLLEQILLECEICLFSFAMETLNIFFLYFIIY